jgi:ribosome-associated heat shock protein Hsp15
MSSDAIRIDKFLWFVRLAKSRSIAQRQVESGAIRIDRVRPATAHTLVRVGQVITIVAAGQAIVIRVERIPTRRGPAPEAQSCYSLLTSQDAIDANGSLA